MFLLRRRIFILLLLLVAVIVSIVILKANTSLESTDRKASAEIKTEESTHNVDEYVLQDPVASIDGVDISKDEFLDFVEATQGERIDRFPSKEVLEGYLDSYALYNTLELRAIELGLDRLEDARDELEVLELIFLANMFDDSELPFREEELESELSEINVELSNAGFAFLANKQFRISKDQAISDEPAIKDLIVEAYKKLHVKAKQAKLAGMNQNVQYKKGRDWLRKEYLSDLYIQFYLDAREMTDEAVSLAMDKWSSNQDFSEYKVSHIYFDDPKLAQNVLQKIKNGELSFGDAAFTYSLDGSSKQSNGKLGGGDWVTFPDITHPFKEALKMLKIGDITPNIVKGISGYHIIQLNDQKEGGIPEYMDMDKVKKNAWMQLELSNLYNNIIKDFDVFIY